MIENLQELVEYVASVSYLARVVFEDKVDQVIWGDTGLWFLAVASIEAVQ